MLICLTNVILNLSCYMKVCYLWKLACLVCKIVQIQYFFAYTVQLRQLVGNTSVYFLTLHGKTLK